MNYLKKHNRMFLIIGTILLSCVNIVLLYNFFLPRDVVASNNTNYNDRTIYLPKIKAYDTLLKFIDIVNNNEELYPCDRSFLTKEDDTYYLGIYQDILLFITMNDDNIYQMGLILDGDSPNLDIACKYFEIIINLNNEFIFPLDDYIDKIMDNPNKTIDLNNGLLGSYIIDIDEINLVIERKQA